MTQVLLFSLTAMFNPTLLAMSTLMLLLPEPKKLMLSYLAGALLTSVTLGLVIVFTLQDSSFVNTAKRTINPAVDIAVGALLLVVAVVLRSGRRERYAEARRAREAEKEESRPPRWERALSRGSPRVTFALGVALTLPGASYLAALASVSKLDYGTAATVLVVLLVNVIMLALLEIPLVGFYVAPEATPAAVERAKSWFSRNAIKAVIAGAAGVGTLLILRGVITLVS
jgi:Sap, sulfolipid-1-addressing protein